MARESTTPLTSTSWVSEVCTWWCGGYQTDRGASPRYFNGLLIFRYVCLSRFKNVNRKKQFERIFSRSHTGYHEMCLNLNPYKASRFVSNLSSTKKYYTTFSKPIVIFFWYIKFRKNCLNPNGILSAGLDLEYQYWKCCYMCQQQRWWFANSSGYLASQRYHIPPSGSFWRLCQQVGL